MRASCSHDSVICSTDSGSSVSGLGPDRRRGRGTGEALTQVSGDTSEGARGGGDAGGDSDTEGDRKSKTGAGGLICPTSSPWGAPAARATRSISTGLPGEHPAAAVEDRGSQLAPQETHDKPLE